MYRADATAGGAAFGAGFLAGYRLPLGVGGVYLSPEADVTFHDGAVRGRFEGAGFSEGRNQLGESWPEDWSFEEKRSYGVTARLGAGIGSDASVYGRLEATFSADYTACFNATLCTADEFVTGTDIHDEAFTGWTGGAALEKRLGNTSMRGELRYTDYGGTGRVVPYPDLAITVPLSLLWELLNRAAARARPSPRIVKRVRDCRAWWTHGLPPEVLDGAASAAAELLPPRMTGPGFRMTAPRRGVPYEAALEQPAYNVPDVALPFGRALKQHRPGRVPW